MPAAQMQNTSGTETLPPGVEFYSIPLIWSEKYGGQPSTETFSTTTRLGRKIDFTFPLAAKF